MAQIIDAGNGQYIYNTSPTTLQADLAAAAGFGIVPPSNYSTFDPLIGPSAVTALGGIGVGPVSPGATLPGGTAGFPTAAQRRATQGADWLAGLSHLTGGLTWSHLILWLAILLGGYLVIEHFAGGKRGRRR